MPPNFTDTNIAQDAENIEDENKQMNGNEVPNSPTPFLTHVEVSRFDTIGLVLSWLNLVANIFIGATVSAVYIFAFRVETFGATPLHAVLCTTGYQLLMAQAILSLSQHNTWTSKLSLLHKRRVHAILQISGSILAITGSFIKIADKDVHWNSLHGRFALVALVFTSVSLVNGVASNYAQELRRCLPGNITKLLHVCFGTVAFSASSVTLCIGLQKVPVVSSLNQGLANTFVAFVVIVYAIIVVSPLLNLYKKSTSLIARRRFN